MDPDGWDNLWTYYVPVGLFAVGCVLGVVGRVNGWW
jgi:hypothetical protein